MSQKLRVQAVKRIIDEYEETPCFAELARKYDTPTNRIWPNDIRRAVLKGKARPGLIKALYPPRERCRFTADVDRKTIDRLDALLKKHNVTRTWLIEHCVEWMDADGEYNERMD